MQYYWVLHRICTTIFLSCIVSAEKLTKLLLFYFCTTGWIRNLSLVYVMVFKWVSKNHGLNNWFVGQASCLCLSYLLMYNTITEQGEWSRNVLCGKLWPVPGSFVTYWPTYLEKKFIMMPYCIFTLNKSIYFLGKPEHNWNMLFCFSEPLRLGFAIDSSILATLTENPKLNNSSTVTIRCA